MRGYVFPTVGGWGGISSSSTNSLDGTPVPALHCGKARGAMRDTGIVARMGGAGTINN